MDVFLDSCDGKSLLGCLEDDCPAGLEPDIFELELRAHKDVFEAYEDRVEKTTDTFINENLSMDLTKSSLTFANARSNEVGKSQTNVGEGPQPQASCSR